MKRLMLAALVFPILATAAHAQAALAADVALSPSVIEVVKGFRATATGGSGSVAFSINRWLSAVSDFGVYHASLGGADVTGEIYTSGPRISYRHWGRWVPFGQVLAGGSHASAATGFAPRNAFTFAAGGGSDIGLDSLARFAVRPQVEYFSFNPNGKTTGAIRVSVGMAFRIRKR